MHSAEILFCVVYNPSGLKKQVKIENLFIKGFLINIDEAIS